MAELSVFAEAGYQSINRARLDHLASLGLPLHARIVLEVGAGVGDLTPFWLERECKVTSTDARAANVAAIQRRHLDADALRFDVEEDRPIQGGDLFGVVFCYGLLYHLADPARAIEALASVCHDLLLIETVVSADGTLPVLSLVEEDAHDARNAMRGQGSRFTRAYLLAQLTRHAPHVYWPRTQPDHADFPLDWTVPLGPGLHRCVVVASRRPFDLPTLTDTMPTRQEVLR